MSLSENATTAFADALSMVTTKTAHLKTADPSHWRALHALSRHELGKSWGMTRRGLVLFPQGGDGFETFVATTRGLIRCEEAMA